MKITITASTIRAAAVAAASKDIRYYLVGVHVSIAHEKRWRGVSGFSV
jgi:hypothetical protein